MPSETKTNQSSRPHRIEIECDGSRRVYYSNFVRRRTTNQYNLPSHRVKPKPLYSNLTAYNEQFVSDRVHGLYYRFRPRDTICPSNDLALEEWVEHEPPSPAVLLPTVLDWQTKLRLKIKSRAVNLGTTLVEYRQTADMFSLFARKASSAYRDYRDLRRLRFRKLSPCDVAAAELTYSYGLEPLANDLYDSYQALGHKLTEPNVHRIASAVKEEHTEVWTSGPHRSVVDWSFKQYAIAYVEFIANANDFTIGNPAELAWEVVPFSFVVDWAIPIGEALSALDALKDVKSITGTVTTKRKWNSRVTSPYLENLGYSQENPTRHTFKGVKRDIITSIPLPSVPKWDPSKSFRAVAHGLSLLTVLSDSCQSRGHRLRR